MERVKATAGLPNCQLVVSIAQKDTQNSMTNGHAR